MVPTEAELNAGIVFGIGALNNDEVRPRLDIDVMLAKQPDMFNLFLLALSDLKADGSKLGYFQLAGIHGLPTSLWDGVGKDSPDEFGGYCAHGRLIFPTWHRPYLALLEQTLYRKMLSIVREYDRPYQSKYASAARAFRLPYWDYFRPRDVDARFPGIKLEGGRTRYDYDFRMPDILNVKEVMIRMPPHDKLELRSNPLYAFRFTDKLNLDKDWSRAKLRDFSRDQTVRRPRDRDSKSHNVQELSEVLNSGREGRTAMMLEILNPNSSRYPRLGDVASDTVFREGDMTQTRLSKETSNLLPRDGSGRPASYGSIEALHGNFHTLIGGDHGHMSHPSIAAFDPVFWLHHCNVDRIFAIWQALHPTAWFPPPQRDSRGRLAKAESEKDLMPFYKYICELGRIYYDSDWARDTRRFGYTYPDLDHSQDPRVIWREVYERYIWSVRSASSRRFSSPPSDMRPLDLGRAQVFQYSGSGTNPRPNPRPPAPDRGHSETTRVVYKRVNSSGSDTLVRTTTTTTTTSERSAADGRVIYRVSSSGSDGLPTEQRPLEGTSRHSSYTRNLEYDIDPYFDREWFVDNVVKRNALNGPFTIYFFLCPKSRFPDDPADYAMNPYLAGINHVFAAPREVCDNCGQQDAAGVLASDTVPITALLLDYMANGTLDSMHPEHVRPFLVKHLRWRVVYEGSSKADPRHLPSFEVVVSAKISHDDGGTSYEAYPDVVEDIIYNSSW